MRPTVLPFIRCQSTVLSCSGFQFSLVNQFFVLCYFFELVVLLSMNNYCRTQWPRNLKHELSSPSQMLASWVLIHSRHGCLSLSVYVVLCVGRGLVTGWSPVQGVLRTCIGLSNWLEPSVMIVIILIMNNYCFYVLLQWSMFVIS